MILLASAGITKSHREWGPRMVVLGRATGGRPGILLPLRTMKTRWLLPVLLLSALSARAVVLTFDLTGIANFQNINQAYGDNVTAFTSGGFSYGSAHGLTPNIVVAYGNTDPALWTTGFGSLTNILNEDQDNTGILTITLTADAGYEVQLHGFDLAAFPVFGSDPTVGALTITSGATTLHSQNSFLVSQTAFTPFTFGTPLAGASIVIQIDARNLGAANDDIGLDNLAFSQVAIPEPSTWAALAGASALLGALVRRRNLARS